MPSRPSRRAKSNRKITHPPLPFNAMGLIPYPSPGIFLPQTGQPGIPACPAGAFRGRLRPLFLGAAFLCLSLSGAMQAQVPAPVSNAQPNEVYNKAMTAFAAGDFAAAVQGLEEMLKLGAEGPGMEGVHFSLAAAHFNQHDAAKAKAGFENYLKLYPSGAKAVDALMGVAQCQTLLGEKEKAAATFELVAQKAGVNQESAGLSRAQLLKEMGKADEAAKVLQAMVAQGLKSPEAVQAALLLSSVEVARGDRDNGLKILTQLQGRLLNLVENPLQLDALAFEIGDAYLHAAELKKALHAYGLIRKKEETIQLQQNRIQSLARRIEANIAAAKIEPTKTPELNAANQRLKQQYDTAKQSLEQANAAPDTAPALRARQASAYQQLGRFEEAILLFESLLSSPDKAGREDTLFSLGSLNENAGYTAESVRHLEELLKEFPKTKYLDSALLLLGTQQLQQDQSDKAAESFSKLLKQAPKSQYLGSARFLLANTRFAQSRFKEALEEYGAYLKALPSGEFAEEAFYRSALAHFFSGQYAPALEAFEEYSRTHPDGLFAPDAAYRIAACYQAASKTAEVVSRCLAWEAKYGDHPVAGDVFALHGDALSALNKPAEAVEVYRKASLRGATDEVVHYALFEANKLLQKLGRSEEAAVMFKEFLAAKPEHPSAVLAMYWIAKATHKAGKPEEAKAFLSEKIKTFIANREQDAVEQLLAQLAQLCTRPPRPTTSETQPSGSETAPGTATSPAPYDAKASLAQFLNPKDFPDTPLVKARLLYAQAELARMLRKNDEAATALDAICDKLPPNALGAALLAQSGDRLLERNQPAQALTFYKELTSAFPKSDLIEYAFNGQGQIALLEGKPEVALRWFDDAIDKAGAATKLRDVTLGRAKALLALGKPDEAKPILEQVASTREWRGECTAEAVFLLGEVLAQKGDLPGAIQLFQRVFVAYQKYERFVGRAYLRAAECFEKLGEPAKAIAHYRELATKPRLASLPEVQTARKRLTETESK